jgi:hypothetical protein
MNTQWLAQLAPEHAPAPPGWWPPAPGWWACLAVAALLAGGLLAWWRDPRRRLRRAALQELRAIRTCSTDPGATARAVENVLRRYALAVFGAGDTARLTGAPWLAFIGSHGGPAAADSWGPSLLAACFGPAASAANPDRERWLAGAETFVRRAGPARNEVRGARRWWRGLRGRDPARGRRA